MHYYPFNIGDFNLHTSHLTLEEEGVFRRLLDFYYDTESPIPLITQPVIRRLRLVNYESIVESILEEFFVKMDDGWHNLRADIEISDYVSKGDIARNNGRKGGRPKKNRGSKTQSVILANPDLTQSKAKQELELVTSNQELLTNNYNKSLKDTSILDSVFQYWQSVMGKQNSRLTPTRKTKINSRLKHFSEEQIKSAIDGCSKSQFHMGENDNRTEYNDIVLICRNDENIEKFMAVNIKQSTTNGILEDWINA